MNKTIYDEALEELKELEVILYYDVSKIKAALKQAQKQEKLLELYKEINNKRKELITLASWNTWSWELEIEIKDIQDKIKEQENDKRKVKTAY